MDLSDDVSLFYSDLAEEVSTVSGGFCAFLDPADQSAWDSPRISTHSLRYPDSVALSTGQLLTIKCQTYKVAAIPMRLNADEFTAELIRQ